MVDVAAREEMWQYYLLNRREIIDSGAQFAVVYKDHIHYFSSEEALYDAHPEFRPDAEVRFGTFPLLIDVREEKAKPEDIKEEGILEKITLKKDFPHKKD